MDDDRDEADPTDPKGLPEPADAAEDDGIDTPADLPSDVESALSQLVESAREAVRDGRVDHAVAAVDTARTVARKELPDGDPKDRLLHGCSRVEDLAEADPTVASEYLDAMGRRLP